MTEGDIERFWTVARSRAKLSTLPGYLPASMLEMVPPPAWSFGATPEQADLLLALVLDGTKTATASARSAYDAPEGTDGVPDEPLPEAGTLGIVLDGVGAPQALVVTTTVHVVAFDQVDAEHAHAEGEGDRSLAHWREVHKSFFAEHAPGGFRSDMPVVLEHFTVLYRAATGRLPFHAETGHPQLTTRAIPVLDRLATSRFHGDLVRAEQDLPVELATIIDHMLALEADLRPTADEAHQLFESFLADAHEATPHIA